VQALTDIVSNATAAKRRIILAIVAIPRCGGDFLAKTLG
jgi:hypothetical protein